MSLSTSFGAIAAPNTEVFGRQKGAVSVAPEFRYQRRQVLAPDHPEGQRTERELWRAMQPRTIQETYAELGELFGNDAARQYEETIQILQQQYDMLESRQRELERAMREPINPMESLMPMLMLGVFAGDLQTAMLGTIMQLMMLPQLEEQKRDRYWKAITEVLGEKNKVISSLRTWESLSLRERQELLRQARMYTGQMNETALRALNTFAQRRLNEFRLGLQSEQDEQVRRTQARGHYFRTYNDMLRVLEMYHRPDARAEILQSFAPVLSQMAQEAGLVSPPHERLIGVLPNPSIRASQAVLNLALALQRGEINQLLFHSRQLGLIQQQLAIRKANEIMQKLRSGQTERLSLSALATIYRFAHFIEDEAYANPEVMQRMNEQYGSNWVQEMRNLRARISAQIIGMADEPVPTQQLNDLARQVAFDENQFNRYLQRVLMLQYGINDVNEMPLEEDALQFLQDLYGNVRLPAPVDGGVTTYTMNQFAQQIYQQALASAGSHFMWDPETAWMRPNTPSPSGLFTPPFGTPSASTGTTEGPALAPTNQTPAPSSVAVRPLSSILFPIATSTNIVDLDALADAANKGATLQVPVPSPEINQTLSRIQARHLVRFQDSSGQTFYDTMPLIGLSSALPDMDHASLRRYNGLHAHRVFRDLQTNQIVIGLSLPILSRLLNTGQGSLRYDYAPELRRILYDPNTRTDTDLVLEKTPNGTLVPMVTVSALYPVQVSGRVQGYRVPLLKFPVHMLGTLFENWLEDSGLAQYGLPNRYRPLSAQETNQVAPWLTQLRALFASGGAWEQALQRIQETILKSGLPEHEQRTQLQRVWQEFRAIAQQALNGQDLFRSIRWLPITYY